MRDVEYDDVVQNIKTIISEKGMKQTVVAERAGFSDSDFSNMLNAALLGEALGLSPSPQLGQFYMVPFKNNKKNCKEAQFQLGYKGYIQLAIRSGYYKKLNVLPIKEGELIRYGIDYDRLERIQMKAADKMAKRPIYLDKNRIDKPLPKGAVPVW